MTEALPIFLAAWAALAAAAISPGPNMVAVASRGLGAGKGSALATAFGISLGGFVWATLTALGLGVLFETFPILLRSLGIVGGSYLVWLGYKGWGAAVSNSTSDIAPTDSAGLRRDILHGLIVTASNPKVALMWASISTFLSAATTSLSLLFLFAFVSSLVLFAVYASYGLLFSSGGVRRLYERYQKLTEALFGTLFGALGLGMVTRALRGG